jgi:endonuclease/exonuclease/phosphatase family metal-dependent hydrolase
MRHDARPSLPLRTLALACAAFAPLAVAAAPPTKSIDGDFADWRETEIISTDDHFLYLRIDKPRRMSLQGSEFLTVIGLDADADPSTGETWRDALDRALGAAASPTGLNPGAEPLGVDLLITLSPRNDEHPEWRNGGGARLHAITEGQAAEIRHFDAGFTFQPTHASVRFESRLSRHADLPGDIGAALRDAGPINARIARLDAQGRVYEQTAPLTVDASPAAPSPWLADAVMPERPQQGVRVLVWNVLWGSPMANPGAFSKVFRAINADILLLQEWDVRDFESPMLTPAQLEAWLNRFVPLEGDDWTVTRAKDARGILIASRFPITPIEMPNVGGQVDTDGSLILEREPRVAFAEIDTPIGPILAASLHLKCCGSLGGTEDLLRMIEATSINIAMHELAEQRPDAAILIGGDVNLVGSPAPLEILRSGLDPLHGDLLIADTDPLGGHATLTWKQPDSPYTPAHLDYLLYSGSIHRAANAFILDEDVLSDAALASMGLARGDTHGSDHLPVIVDLVPADN